MGQGTESCGGYEIHYDPYEDGLDDGMWCMMDGTPIHVSNMSLSHLKNAIRICRRKELNAPNEDDEAVWDAWQEVFQREIERRNKLPTKATSPKKQTRGAKVEVTCECGSKFTARVADRKRGWGKYCSKSCKAKYH